jgi:hypothetical protein
MEEADQDGIEIVGLENALLQAEYKYRADMLLMQKALLRTKRLENLHILTLHLKFKPLLKSIKRLPVQYLFYRWKSKCNIDRTNRIKKVAKLLRYLYKKNMTKAFLLFRERGNRFQMQKFIDPGYQNFNSDFRDL